VIKARVKRRRQRKSWILDDMDPVLEELPTWSSLTDTLKEIEEEMMGRESSGSFRPSCKCPSDCNTIHPKLMKCINVHLSVHLGSGASLDNDIFIQHLNAHFRVLVDHGCICCTRVTGSEDDGQEFKGWKGNLGAGTQAGG
jgi:hypothetical protein